MNIEKKTYYLQSVAKVKAILSIFILMIWGSTYSYAIGTEDNLKKNKTNDYQTVPKKIEIKFIGLQKGTIQENSDFKMVVTITPAVESGTLKLQHYFSGTSTLNVDYISINPIVFTPGVKQVEKKISILDDNELEGDETLIINVSVTSLSGYTLDESTNGSKSYTFTIRDSELFQINVVNGSGKVNEGETLNIYAELVTTNAKGEIDASVSVSDGYIIPFTVELMVPTMSESGSSSMNIVEPNQDIYITQNTYAFDQKTINKKTIPIQIFLYDDDIIENKEEVIILFKRICTSGQKIKECLPSSSYSGNVIKALFSDSRTEEASLRLQVLDNEQALIQLKEVVYGIEKSTTSNQEDKPQAKLIFQLNKQNGIISKKQDDIIIISPITFLINLTNGSAIGASEAGGGSDYENKQIEVTFGNNMNEATAFITIFDDNGSEGTEFFYAQIARFNYQDAAIKLDNVLREKIIVKILDDEKPTVSMLLENEGNESLNISPSIKFEYINSNKDVTEDVVINLEYSGTAKINVDYTVTSSMVTVKSNVSVTRLSIPLIIDNIIEGVEYIEVKASIVGNVVAMGNDYLKILIKDKNYPTIRSSQTTEGKEGLANSKFTLSLNVSDANTESELSYDLKIPFKIKSSQAEIGTDVTSTPFFVTIKSGSLQGSFEFDVIDDNVYEQVEIMNLTISKGDLYDIYDAESLAFSIGITDNEVLPIASISFQGRAISEDNGSAIISVRITDANSRTVRSELPIDITFNFSGEAVRNDDYIFPKNITINPYTTAKELVLQTQVDSNTEGNQMLTVALDTIENGIINAKSNSVTINILEGETLPIISLISLDNSSISENNGTANLLLVFPSLSHENREVVLELTGSAKKGKDYNISQDKLIIESGFVSKRVTIISVNDEEYEENEFISVGVKNMNYGQPIIIQIIDDDLNTNLITITTDKKFALADGKDTVNIFVRLRDVNGNTITTKYDVRYEIPDITATNEIMNFDATSGLYNSAVSTQKAGVYNISFLINNSPISTKKQITFEYETIVPNEIITPNGDNINEFWYIKGIDLYLNNSVFIYDFNGNLVWETTAYNNKDNFWTGDANVFSHQSLSKLKGGTYYYRLMVPRIPLDKRGLIELIK